MRDVWWKMRILWLHLSRAIEAWRAETKFDERMCCDGRECGCQGSSWRSFWEHEFGRNA